MKTTATRTRRGGRPAGRAPGLTRQAILAAATREFAARGYAGTGVDRIARGAAVNKAMIYYHFGSKAGLYRAILRGLFEPAGDQARAIVASDRLPEEKLDALVASIAARVFAQPELPPIMMREIAEGARHLDRQMLRAMAAIYQAMSAILDEGRQRGRFAKVRPLLVYFTAIAPLVLFVGASPVRQAMGRLRLADDWECNAETFQRYLQQVLRRLLMPVPSRRPSREPASAARPSAGGHRPGPGRLPRAAQPERKT
jgi:TetR/AcrR family transcriptional regulator